MSHWISEKDCTISSDFREANKAAESTNAAELTKLATSADSGVRARVAANVNTPMDVLLGFKNDLCFVKIFLLRNRKITPEIVKTFIRDEDTLFDEDKLFKEQVYRMLLDNYKFGKVDLTGKELFQIISYLASAEGNLIIAEIMEDVRSTREEELKKLK